jgi:Mrp family chromosome partitioning ATPase
MLEALQRIEARTQSPCPAPHILLRPAAETATAPAAKAIGRAEPSGAPALHAPGELTTRSQQEATQRVPSSRPRDDELYQHLAGNILSQLPADRPAVLMFTSALDRSGKTTTLARLAEVMSGRAGGEVLAVDANFRWPDLGGRLRAAAGPSIIDVLTGAVPWSDAVQETATPGLKLLPGGRFLPSDCGPPAWLDLGTLLDEIHARYRLVLIDAPSLIHPEVAPLGPYCDGLYLVVRLHQCSRRALREAARAIHQSQGRLLGSIVLGS